MNNEHSAAESGGFISPDGDCKSKSCGDAWGLGGYVPQSKSQTQILIAGFGGQGILFAGKFLAADGLLSGREVSWLPSYGPEMRGGTANCSVILSDSAIGSPIVNAPDILVAMNAPSLDKFKDSVAPGGQIFFDSSLMSSDIGRGIPATTLASQSDLDGLANMIMLGFVIAGTGIIDAANVERTMKNVVSEKKQKLFEANLRAIALGAAYQS